MSDFECPYCEAKYDYCDDPLKNDQIMEWECYECNKLFTIRCNYYVDYTAEKAECLNTGNHFWKDGYRHPRIISKKIRQDCQEGCGRTRNRDATEEEIAKEVEDLKEHPSLQRITLGK